MCDIFKAEFKLKNFRFPCSKPEALYTCQWKWHRAIYWTIRVIMAAYALGAVMTVYVMSVGEKHVVLVYLTIWTFTLLTIHLWIATVITIFYRPTMNKSGEKMHGVTNPDFLPSSVESTLSQTADSNRNNIEEDKRYIPWFLKLSWLLGDVVLSFEIVVSIIYFVFLFPDKENRGVLINDMNMHAMNTVFVLIDFFISARPVYLLHVIYPIIYGTIYAIFSAIYWTQDHVNNVLYSVLDWNSPGNAVGLVVILAVVILPLFQLIFFGLHRLKLKIYYHLYKTT
ncbi:protein rolling stone-like isoform X1 [Mytilus trossulus]|uniref:protein rolling stone-like isoform X1 n=1 Tax=Mytilus trossulus TaxID=6551 RepID=UPI003006FAF0